MMKWTKKYKSFRLMVGLTILISCQVKEPRFTYIKQHTIPYPSASAIEYYKDRLYIMGDDATHLLVTDTSFKMVDTVRLFADTTTRVPKYKKADVEAAALHVVDGNVQLYFMSSGSLSNRNFLITGKFPLSNFTVDTFAQRQFKALLPQLAEMNIEGLAIINDKWIFANRGNLAQPKNYLIVSPDLPLKQGLVALQNVQWQHPHFIGVSGLFYDTRNDILWLTGSEEATTDATRDGAIGDSHLAWVKNYGQKLKDSIIRLDGSANLSKQFPNIKGHKIESVTMQQLNDGTSWMYLAADNDNGQSTLFKLKLSY